MVIRVRPDRLEEEYSFRMTPSGTLVGIVKSAAGELVKGAKVYVPNGFVPVDGFNCATTDRNGKFRLDDLPLLNRENGRRRPIVAEHPDHGKTTFWIDAIPNIVRCTFLPTGVGFRCRDGHRVQSARHRRSSGRETNVQ